MFFAMKTFFNENLVKNRGAYYTWAHIWVNMVYNQKNAALRDLEIWVDIEKCESNKAPRLCTA